MAGIPTIGTLGYGRQPSAAEPNMGLQRSQLAAMQVAMQASLERQRLMDSRMQSLQNAFNQMPQMSGVCGQWIGGGAGGAGGAGGEIIIRNNVFYNTTEPNTARKMYAQHPEEAVREAYRDPAHREPSLAVGREHQATREPWKAREESKAKARQAAQAWVSPLFCKQKRRDTVSVTWPWALAFWTAFAGLMLVIV